MQTILDALEYQATRQSNRVFCHFLKSGQVETITFFQLYLAAGRYANFFQSRNLVPGQVVLIILPQGPELYSAFLGAMLAGLVPSFMPLLTSKQDPKLFWESHRALFQRLGAGAVLTSPEHQGDLRRHLPESTWPVFTPSEAKTCSNRFPGAPLDPESLALLQHSSGTTGLKKGVPLTHRAVLDQVAGYAAALDLSPADRIVSWLPLYHDMGLVACFLLPLITGTPLVQMDPFEWVARPQLLFEAVTHFRSTLAWMPNFAFEHLSRLVKRAGALDLSSMRAWINCSEPCRAETFGRFEQCFGPLGVAPAQLQVCYAMAETVFAVTQTPLGRPVRSLRSSAEPAGRRTGPGRTQGAWLSAGPPISSLACKIVSPAGLPLGEGQVGEIMVSGNCLFPGYYRQPEATAEKLRRGWYRTGDLGFCSQGELCVTGRCLDLIIVHGRNFYAHELEFVANQVPGVKPGRVTALGHFRPEVGSEEVVILAEAQANGARPEFLGADIKQHVLDESGLLPYDVRIVPPGWLVKTTSGKLSRGANLEKYLAESLVAAK